MTISPQAPDEIVVVFPAHLNNAKHIEGAVGGEQKSLLGVEFAPSHAGKSSKKVTPLQVVGIVVEVTETEVVEV